MLPYEYMLWRKKHRLTLFDVSKAIHISEPVISRFENGKLIMDSTIDRVREKYDEFIKNYENRKV